MLKLKMISLALAMAATGTATHALAAEPAGLAIHASQLGAADRATLEHAVMADRLARPAAYDLVAVAKGCRPDGWKVARNPEPVCSRELRGLGQAGLLPMLSALALDWQPDVSRLSAAPELREKEQKAMLVAMVEAVGLLRDARARPVLQALWSQAADRREVQAPVERANSVVRTTAEAIGRMGGAIDLQQLQKHLRADDPLYTAAIAGLGVCKRTDSAQLLAQALAETKDETMQRWIVAAMGSLASSWSWQALGKAREPDGLRVRQRVTEVLLPLLAKTHGEARERVVQSLQLADMPDLPTRLATVRATSDATLQHDIDDLLGRFARAHTAR